MPTMPHSPPTLAAASTGRARHARRAAGDDGVALVEFAFVAVLFFILIIGIVCYGVILSFQQTMTQAANEAARSAAVITDNPTTVGTDERFVSAQNSINAFNSWNRPCTVGGTNGMTCTVVKHDCVGATDTVLLPDCITVTMTFDYAGHPILPAFPLMSAALPSTLTANATAQISDPNP